MARRRTAPDTVRLFLSKSGRRKKVKLEVVALVSLKEKVNPSYIKAPGFGEINCWWFLPIKIYKTDPFPKVQKIFMEVL